MVRALILVFLGGGAGSCLRYLVSVFGGKQTVDSFPTATFVTNMIGCLAIGVLLGIAERNQWSSPDFKLLFVTGFCGGFTTFSAFSAESLRLIQNDHFLLALLYIGGSLLLGILSTWLGFLLTK